MQRVQGCRIAGGEGVQRVKGCRGSRGVEG